jgi:hypothetical protein
MPDTSGQPFSGDGSYSRIKELFGAAEAELKAVEQQDCETVIPAINQLRYAGFHILQSITDDDVEKTKHIGKAESHAKRAMHDALEAGILGSLQRIDNFKTDYRHLSIPPIWPEYVSLCSEVEMIKKKMLGIQPRNHVANNELLQSYNTRLYEIVLQFDAARTELNKELRNRSRRLWYSSISISAAVLAVILGALQFFFMFLN